MVTLKNRIPPHKELKMSSKLLRVLLVGLMTLFLSGQAFAWGSSKKDSNVSKNPDQDKPSMYDQSDRNKALPSDQDLKENQRMNQKQDFNKSKSLNPSHSGDY
jgi:hypothetical protein